MSVKMRAIGTFHFHGNIVKPGDVIIGSTSEYEVLRAADCAVIIGRIEDTKENAMVDTRKATEKRVITGRR